MQVTLKNEDMTVLPILLSTLSALPKLCKGGRELRGHEDSLARVGELFKATHKVHSNSHPHPNLQHLPQGPRKNTSLIQTFLRSEASGSLWAQEDTRAPKGSLNNTGGLLQSSTCVSARQPWCGQALGYQSSGASHTQRAGGPVCLGPLSREDGLWVCYSLAVPTASAYSTPHFFSHVEFTLGVPTCSSWTGRKLTLNTSLSRGVFSLKSLASVPKVI